MFKYSFYKYSLILIVSLLFFSSCSTKKKSWVSRQYHNTTARYNGYFNGNQSIKKGLKKIDQTFEDDYSQILPIFKTGDLQKSKTAHSYMDKAIQKSSVVIQKHSIKIRGVEYCKWIDDNYLLLGKSYFYKGDIEEALRSFSFLKENYKKSEIRFLAEIWMAKCYIEKKDFASAENVLIELENNKRFPKKYKFDFNIVSADSYMRQKNYSLATDHLQTSIKLVKTKKQKTRLNFILAQVYQNQKIYSKSRSYYKEVLSSSPEYVMTFNAKMNLALSSNKNNNDYNKIRSSLIKMSKDDKNKEYLDQIFYTLGRMDQQKNDTVSAVTNYLESTINSVENSQQKGLSFLALSEISFIQKDFLQSKIYYDSTAFFLSESYEFYSQIIDRKNILTDLVFYLNTVHLEDSLQSLALLSKDQLDLVITEVINKELEKEKERIEQETGRQQNMMNNSGRGGRNEQFGNNTSGGKWYFYNPATLSFGLSEFRKNWGKRKLEDNWRRSNKNSEGSFESDSTQNTDAKNQSFNTKDPQFYLSQIPSTLEDFQLSNKKIVNSCFQAALIFRENLNCYEKANEMLKNILTNNNVDSNYLAMTLFSLFQNLTEKEKFSRAEKFKTQLTNDFPNSLYAKLLYDSKYLQKITEANIIEENRFDQVLSYFKNEEFDNVLLETKNIYTNDFSVKYKFLRALSFLKKSDTLSFLSLADNIKKDYPKNKISIEIDEILKVLKDPGLMNEANAKAELGSAYLKYDNSKHLLAIVMPREGSDVNYLKTIISDFHANNYPNDTYEISAVLLGVDQHLVTIKSFENKAISMSYYSSINDSPNIINELAKYDYKIMAIAVDNFAEFYKNKDVKGYNGFFNKTYLK